MFDPVLNDLARMSGWMLVISGGGWIIHDCLESGKIPGMSSGSKRNVVTT